MTIYDKTRMVFRTFIGQLNALFTMGSELESAVDGKQDVLTFDDTPTSGSSNPVTSDGIYTAIQTGGITIDSVISSSSTNPVQNKVIYNALQNVEIDVDSALSSTSSNPVQNKVITVKLNDYALLSALAEVATSGSYTDLSDIPDFADVATSGDYNDLENTPNLAAVATSGDYYDLDNRPLFFNITIGSTQPTSGRVGDLYYDESAANLYICTSTTPTWTLIISGSGATVAWGNVTGSLENQLDLIAKFSNYVLASSLATVATSGSYSDLSNTPDLSVYALSSSLARVATTGAYSDLSGTPSLANVATSGAYSDLSGTPTVPTIVDNSTYYTITY